MTVHDQNPIGRGCETRAGLIYGVSDDQIEIFSRKLRCRILFKVLRFSRKANGQLCFPLVRAKRAENVRVGLKDECERRATFFEFTRGAGRWPKTRRRVYMPLPRKASGARECPPRSS